MAKFEKVSRFEDVNLPLPVRKTAQSAGYDFVVAEDIMIPSYSDLTEAMYRNRPTYVPTLEGAAEAIKNANAKITLVSTGMKCQLDPGTYLELSVRDADYYNNPDNEGEIFFQIINLAPFPIKLKRGDAIGQGIIKPYLTTEDDTATGIRIGGFGSTDIIIDEELQKLVKDISAETRHEAHAEGYSTVTSGQYSHAEGAQNVAR